MAKTATKNGSTESNQEKKKATKVYPPSAPHEEGLYAMLREDPELVQEYLTAALEDTDPGAFLTAIKDVAGAYGISMTTLASVAGMSREHLYEMLSSNGNPKWVNVKAVLQVLGIHLSARMDLAEKSPAKRTKEKEPRSRKRA